MTTMTKNITLALLVAVAGFFLGRFTVKERTVTVEARMNIDSLTNVIRQGIKTPPPEVVIRYIKEYVDRTDTVWRSDEWDEVPYYTAELDTVLNAKTFIIHGPDTSRIETPVRTNVQMGFVGDPINAFNLSRMRLEPFVVEIPYTERVLDESNKWGLHVTVGSRFSTGIIASYGWLGLGWEYHPIERRSEVRAQFRVVSF